ncbi:MAG: hypothetical protein ACP5XB_09815 [Isosphaeraceae bacterium]
MKAPRRRSRSTSRIRSTEYARSPVVIRLEFEESSDGTALAARVTHWKYTRFLDPSAPWFREPRRKITIELNISDAAACVILSTAMQVEADSGSLPHTRPNDGERLPWLPKPVRNLPGNRQPDSAQFFGPVNIEASITEMAEPSRFARMLGRALGSQQAAIERYVKDRLVQALDESEAAKAGLAMLKGASAARAEYESAYQAAAHTRKTLDTAADDAARIAAEQALALQLATLRLKETLARDAFDRAGLSFVPLPAIEALRGELRELRGGDRPWRSRDLSVLFPHLRATSAWSMSEENQTELLFPCRPRRPWLLRFLVHSRTHSTPPRVRSRVLEEAFAPRRGKVRQGRGPEPEGDLRKGPVDEDLDRRGQPDAGRRPAAETRGAGTRGDGDV